jgi:hypothetical protein
MVEHTVEHSKWEESREIALTRDNHRCRKCSTKDNLHVHHLIPRHLEGSDDAENLITLCAACHAAKHPSLQVSLSKSLIEKWALKLARILDFSNEIPTDMEKVKTALSLLGKDRSARGNWKSFWLRCVKNQFSLSGLQVQENHFAIRCRLC